jgi:hypothetical protein
LFSFVLDGWMDGWMDQSLPVFRISLLLLT